VLRRRARSRRLVEERKTKISFETSVRFQHLEEGSCGDDANRRAIDSGLVRVPEHGGRYNRFYFGNEQCHLTKGKSETSLRFQKN